VDNLPANVITCRTTKWTSLPVTHVDRFLTPQKLIDTIPSSGHAPPPQIQRFNAFRHAHRDDTKQSVHRGTVEDSVFTRSRVAAAIGSLILASGLLLLPSSPAYAATCKARVNFQAYSGHGAATEYNGATPADSCSSVQVHINTYIGGGFYSDCYGPTSSTSSYRECIGSTPKWYGRAQPSSSWSELQWANSQNNEWKTFTG